MGRIEGSPQVEVSQIKWVNMSTKNGMPFSFTFPLEDQGYFKKPIGDLLHPFSRWIVGRKKAPNFSTSGSGLEGHLCALDPMTLRGYLHEFNDDAYRILKHDVGSSKVDKFLNEPDSPLSLKLLIAGRTTFEILLAKARAIRGMTQHGYMYDNKGNQIKIPNDRVDRTNTFHRFVYASPMILDLEIGFPEKGTAILKQSINPTITKINLPIEPEFVGGDIGSNPNLKTLAEIGRFGFPLIPLIFNGFA